MKNIKIIIDDKEYMAQLSDEQVETLTKSNCTRTGYERVEDGRLCYVMTIRDASEHFDSRGDLNNTAFNNGNYVNDERLCQDRFRARALHDRLEQWQALNDEPVDWGDRDSSKYFIYYDYRVDELDIGSWYKNRFIETVYFSTEAKAQEAIEVFRDELMWYFTQYRSRLDEPEKKDDK